MCETSSIPPLQTIAEASTVAGGKSWTEGRTVASPSSKPVSDVVVVGGGHNALVCAAYLAEAGLSVTVLEGRDVIGGNTVTEELTLPGWQHDSCSTAHVVLQSNPLIRDDELGLDRTLRAEVHRHRPGGGLPAARRRPADGPPETGRHRRRVRPLLARRRRCARHDDRGLERRPADRARVSVRGTSVARQAVVAQLRAVAAPQRMGRDRLDVPAPGDAPGDGLDGFRHDPAAAATRHRRAARRDHGRSIGLRLGHARRRVGRVAKCPRGPHHRPRRHRRDVGVGAVVHRRGRALRRGAHR